MNLRTAASAILLLALAPDARAEDRPYTVAPGRPVLSGSTIREEFVVRPTAGWKAHDSGHSIELSDSAGIFLPQGTRPRTFVSKSGEITLQVTYVPEVTNGSITADATFTLVSPTGSRSRFSERIARKFVAANASSTPARAATGSAFLFRGVAWITPDAAAALSGKVQVISAQSDPPSAHRREILRKVAAGRPDVVAVELLPPGVAPASEGKILAGRGKSAHAAVKNALGNDGQGAVVVGRDGLVAYVGVDVEDAVIRLLDPSVATAEAAGGLPKGFLLPVMPGAKGDPKVEPLFDKWGERRQTVTFHTDKTPAEVLEFYKASLTSQGRVVRQPRIAYVPFVGTDPPEQMPRLEVSASTFLNQDTEVTIVQTDADAVEIVPAANGLDERRHKRPANYTLPIPTNAALTGSSEYGGTLTLEYFTRDSLDSIVAFYQSKALELGADASHPLVIERRTLDPDESIKPFRTENVSISTPEGVRSVQIHAETTRKGTVKVNARYRTLVAIAQKPAWRCEQRIAFHGSTRMWDLGFQNDGRCSISDMLSRSCSWSQSGDVVTLELGAASVTLYDGTSVSLGPWKGSLLVGRWSPNQLSGKLEDPSHPLFPKSTPRPTLATCTSK